jgi:hypothetical protein
MKSVRYATGAIVGLVPLAALAAPGAAKATDTAKTPTAPSHAAGARTKTVRPLYNHNTCRGQTEAANLTAGNGSEQDLYFWWAWSNRHNEVCIGTVSGFYTRVDSPDGISPTAFRVRIWHDGNIVSSSYPYFHAIGGPVADVKEWSGQTIFRSWYPAPTQVCAAWLEGNNTIGTPACSTIN